MKKITIEETHTVYVGTHICIRGDLNSGGGAVNPLPQIIELGSFRSCNVPSSQCRTARWVNESPDKNTSI